MDNPTTYFYDYADAEFDGRSFNGDSLMKTLEGLSPEAAADTKTWEKYSAWSVALHLAWFKYFMARSILGEAAVGGYPFDHDEDGFGHPTRPDADSWTAVRVYLRKIHRQTAAAIRELGPERLAAVMPEWEIPYGRAVAWYLGHDGYHIAQIRSMGVPGLKK